MTEIEARASTAVIHSPGYSAVVKLGLCRLWLVCTIGIATASLGLKILSTPCSTEIHSLKALKYFSYTAPGHAERLELVESPDLVGVVVILRSQ